MPEADLKPKIKDFEQRITKLEKLFKLQEQFDDLRKEFDDELRALNKQLTPLYDKDAELENRFKALDTINANISKLQKSIDKLSDAIDGTRKEFDAEIRSVKKEMTPLFDKDIELGKKIRSIGKTDEDLITTLAHLQANVTNIGKKVSGMEQTWSTPTLKSIVDGMSTVTKTLTSLEKRSADVVRKLERTNAGVVAISKHASDIEAEHRDAKFASEELVKKSENLKETVDSFFKQIDAVDSKLNSDATALSDLTAAIEALKGRLESVEGQTPNFVQLKELLDDQSKITDQLLQRLAYLEKVTVKTIVLD